MDCSYGQVCVASPQAQRKGPEKLVVLVLVEGISTTDLVDSGCSQTIIWEGLVPDLELSRTRIHLQHPWGYTALNNHLSKT